MAKYRKRAALLALIVISAFLLSGCGRRLVMWKGYGENELLRIGNTQCTLPEYNVFLLNLQKQCERTFGHDVWEQPEGEQLREAIIQRALSEVSRLKVMLLIAVQDNIMLTDSEENIADEAEMDYYENLTEAELQFLNIDEETLCNLFEQYALAQKVYNSAGTSFEERYDSFCTTLDYDINEPLWNTVKLADIEDLTQSPGFTEVYAKYFGSSSLGTHNVGEDSEGEENAEKK
ncbi:MAG TPA: hypothetical protein DCF49_04635 [Lachnospiraceae bacterium]|nr:hypothetical protein [Lachnospiraceae bacterium]